MSVGEVKAGLAAADEMVMQVAEIAGGIGTEVDNIDVLGLATDIENIAGLPAIEVPAGFEAAGARMTGVTTAAGELAVGTLIERLQQTGVAYAGPLTGADRTKSPVSDIFGGLEHMAGKTTELAQGQVALAQESNTEASALFAAAATVREQVAQSHFEDVTKFVAAETAARAAAARDNVEPARAALKPITEEVAATAPAVKESSQLYATQLL
ncbi:MAG TPA: hypothetical protein VLH86_00575 [Patescibacteria group bacterium]|nr:hypothetical protein [Patescibacteria group bacterium]